MRVRVYLLLLRIFGVRVHEVEPGLSRVTIPAKRADWLPRVVENMKDSAWLKGKRVEVDRPSARETVLIGPEGRVEIRVGES